ncbi:MAG: sulfite exporter TauE/SafE family protein [Vulcanibacillus sp.]
MELLSILLILIAGIIAGFLNVIAGGGTLLTMPILIFLGLPSAVANGTNRVALTVQNIVAVLNFKKYGYFDWKLGVLLGIPALFGSIIGSMLAISIPDEIFNKILAVTMLLILGLILWQPEKKFKAYMEKLTLKRKIIAVIVFFFIGIYGGFIQAGVGFIIMASLTLITGLSLVKINSLKVFIVLVYMIVSLGIFIFNGQVNWLYGFILAIGSGIGAWMGSKFSVKKGDKWIRIFLVITVSLMSISLFIK